MEGGGTAVVRWCIWAEAVRAMEERGMSSGCASGALLRERERAIVGEEGLFAWMVEEDEGLWMSTVDYV